MDSYVIFFLRAIFFDLNELKRMNEIMLMGKKTRITTSFFLIYLKEWMH